MTMLNNDEKIIKQLTTKKERLERILSSDYPINPNLAESHDRKVLNAKIFLDEMEEISAFLESGLTVKLVPRPTFEKQLEKADFATLDFDGEFCKIALIQNYPFDDLWLIYTAPVESI